ncbi:MULTISPECIES: hypothetical protein [Streptomyces]|nr:hypothetical protein [Streptomyces sp. NEAU-HV9]
MVVAELYRDTADGQPAWTRRAIGLAWQGKAGTGQSSVMRMFRKPHLF